MRFTNWRIYELKNSKPASVIANPSIRKSENSSIPAIRFPASRLCHRCGTLRYLDRLQPLALLVLRFVLGAIMIAHGYGKVFGGMQNFSHLVSGLGIPGWMAYLSAAAEFGGGILLVLGLITRIAAAAVLVDMLVAISKVHFKNGLMGQGGYEFPLARSEERRVGK